MPIGSLAQHDLDPSGLADFENGKLIFASAYDLPTSRKGGASPADTMPLEE